MELDRWHHILLYHKTLVFTNYDIIDTLFVIDSNVNNDLLVLNCTKVYLKTFSHNVVIKDKITTVYNVYGIVVRAAWVLSEKSLI